MQTFALSAKLQKRYGDFSAAQKISGAAAK